MAPDPKPVRVLLVAPSMDILGGQAVQAQRLLAQLRQEPSLHVDFLPINRRFPRVLRRFESVRFLRTLISFVLYVPSVLAAVPRHDIIHVFSASYWSYTLWSVPPMLIGRLFGKKVVLNYRSGEAEEHLSNWRTAVPTLHLAHEIVAPNRYIADVFARYSLRVRFIPNILAIERFRFRPRGRLRPVFFTNRILEPLYNVGCILRAFQIIQQRYPEAALTIAHDGVCRPGLEALARELGLRNTSFVGRILHDEVAHLYDAADIYITTPNLDCMPGSILECFASGLPVIATKAGGIPYILTHWETGLLVDLDDHRAVAECAFLLLEDEELAARIAANARRECAKYEAAAAREGWLRLYHQLAGSAVRETLSLGRGAGQA